MSSSTVVQSNTSIQVAAPATSMPVSSTEKKKDGRNKIVQSSLSPENKNVEVSELVELDQTQEKCSSETKVIPRHLKTLLRYETCNEGCFPLFRAIISAVGQRIGIQTGLNGSKLKTSFVWINRLLMMKTLRKWP